MKHLIYPKISERIMRRLTQMIIALIACSTGQVQPVLANGTGDWVKENIVNSERLLCQRAVDGEYFFVALAGDDVKVGSRLDMTGYPAAHVLTIAWTFQNEKDDSIVARVPPKAVKQNYTQIADKIFAENVEYQTLAIGQSKTVRVAVEVRKCAGPECDKQGGDGKKDRKYKVEMCAVKASEFLRR